MKKIFSISYSEVEPAYLCTADDEVDALDQMREFVEQMEYVITNLETAQFDGEVRDFDDFVRRYSLVRNVHDEMAGLGGHLFASSGVQWISVQSANPESVWTLIEDQNLWWISPGIHVVNQLGFLLTVEARTGAEVDYIYD